MSNKKSMLTTEQLGTIFFIINTFIFVTSKNTNDCERKYTMRSEHTKVTYKKLWESNMTEEVALGLIKVLVSPSIHQV